MYTYNQKGEKIKIDKDSKKENYSDDDDNEDENENESLLFKFLRILIIVLLLVGCMIFVYTIMNSGKTKTPRRNVSKCDEYTDDIFTTITKESYHSH